jgi:hypothetical protein
MFQNPMMLITVFGGLMMLAMPYIMVSTSDVSTFLRELTRSMVPPLQKNVDPEVLQEAQQNQARLRNALQSGDPKSGWVLCCAVPYWIIDRVRKKCPAYHLSRAAARHDPQ